jgi:hypothetical protein
MGGNWPGAVRPLSWLIRKFSPAPDWTTPEPATAGVVYFTDNRLRPDVFNAAQRQLARSINGHRLVTASLVPMDFGQNIVVPGERSRLQMFRQILAGLEALDATYAFLCEHDVLYPREHFAFEPPRDDRFYYDQSVWRVDAETGRAVTYDMMSVSGLCANRRLLVDWYRKVVAEVEREGYNHAQGYEPGVREGLAVGWRARRPYVDVRHGQNLTASRWAPEQFRDKTTCENWKEADGVPGWGTTRGRFDLWLEETT